MPIIKNTQSSMKVSDERWNQIFGEKKLNVAEVRSEEELEAQVSKALDEMAREFGGLVLGVTKPKYQKGGEGAK